MAEDMVDEKKVQTDIDDLTPQALIGITQELLEATEIKPKARESTEDLTKRVVIHVTHEDQRFSNADWDNLSDPAQRFVNHCALCLGKGDQPEVLLTFEEEEPEGATEEITEVEADVETSPKKAAKAKSRSPKGNGTAKAEKKAAPTKAAKAEKKKAAPKATSGRGFSPEAKIKVLAKENPHRKGTILHRYFELYEPGMTVEEAEAAGAKAKLEDVRLNLRYLRSKGVLSIG